SWQAGAGRDRVADGVAASRLETATAIDSRADRDATHLPHGPKSQDEQRQAREPRAVDGDAIYVALENDREFGPIVALSTAATRGRIVRALPTPIDHLRDAVHELVAADVRLAGL